MHNDERLIRQALISLGLVLPQTPQEVALVEDVILEDLPESLRDPLRVLDAKKYTVKYVGINPKTQQQDWIPFGSAVATYEQAIDLINSDTEHTDVDWTIWKNGEVVQRFSFT